MHLFKAYLSSAIAALCLPFVLVAQPTISSFTPITGKPGDVITLTGTNFNTTAANNIVFFGATRATVTAATATSITANVPAGATYAPITLLNTGTGLAASSLSNFTPTFSPAKTTISEADFSTRQDLTTGIRPISVAIGDLDGDGKPDLAVANLSSNSVSVYRNISSTGNTDAGSFAARQDFATGARPYGVAIGDLDGDGKPDLAVGNDGSNTVSVFRNTSTIGTIGASSFDAKVDFATGSYPGEVAIGDLDGDGKPDLAVANYGSDSVSVFRNTSSIGTLGAGSFAARHDFATGRSPYAVAIGDLDGDGKPELAVTNSRGSRTVSVFRNTSTMGSIDAGSFSTKVDFATDFYPQPVAIGDLDGDGKPELVVGNNGSGSVSVYRNTSSVGSIVAGSFAPKQDFQTGAYPYSVAIGDLNGDGKPDLAVASAFPDSVSFLRNTSSIGSIGAGSFAPKQNIASAISPRSVAIGDLDGDGEPDLAIANYGSNAVSVLGISDLPPTISSFSPASGGLGTEVTIRGKNLENTVYVIVGNTNVPMLVKNDTMVVIKLTTVAFGNIALAFSGKTITTGFYFNYNGPIVGELKPTMVKKGTRLVISGSAFGNLQEVRFGNLPGIDVVKISDSRIEVTVPAGVKNDTVYTFFDNGYGFGLIKLAPAPDQIQYTGKRGDTLWLTGDNLIIADGGSTVRIGSRSASIIQSKPDSLQVIVPPVADYGPISFLNKGDYLATFPRAFSPNYQPAMPVNGSTFASADLSSLARQDYKLLLQCDFNNDGREDYIALKNDSMMILRHVGYNQTGHSLFLPSAKSKISSYPRLSLIDMNNDGWQDILIGGNGSFSVLENTTRQNPNTINFSYVYPIIYQGQNGKYFEGISGDLNDQGSHSIIIKDNLGKINLYKNKFIPGKSWQQPGFQFVSSFDVPFVVSHMELADLDGNGLPELLCINDDQPTLFIYRNLSTQDTLVFSSPTLISLPAKPATFTTGDIDADGVADVIVSYNDVEYKTIFMRSAAQPGQPFSFNANFTIPHPNFFVRQLNLVTADGDNRPDLLLQGSLKIKTLAGTSSANSFGFIENKSQTVGSIVTDTLKPFLMEKPANMPGHLGERIETGDRVFVTDDNNDGKPDYLTNIGYVFRNKAGEKPVLYNYRPARTILRDTIDIVGYNLSGVYDVSFGNSKAIIHFASDTLLRVSLQSHEGGNLKITNHFGSDSLPSPVIIQVPSIMSITPKIIAPGGQVTITGKYFSGASPVRVKIGNIWATVEANTDTTIRLTVPHGAVSGKLAVLANGLYGFSRDWLLLSEPSGITELKQNDFLLLDSFYAGRPVPIRSLQITSLNGRDKNDLFLKQDSSFKNRYDYTITKLQPVVLERKHSGQKQLYSRIGLPSTAPYENNDIAWEDLDGNGYPDMFVGIDSDIDNSLLFINKGGDGKLFKNPIQSKDIIWNGPWNFFKADFDLNGRYDIGYRPGQSNGLSLFINTLWKDSIILKKQTFSQYISRFMRHAKPDDIDQDGKADMAWVHYDVNGAGQIHFNRNNSDSGILKLSASTEVVGGEENTTIMDFAMAPIFPENAKNELMLIRRMDLLPGGSVEFFKDFANPIPGYYNPIMEKAFEMPLQYKPILMKLADADGDGRLDILAFLRNPDIETNEQLITHIAVLRNTSQGSDYRMASPVYISLPARAASVEIADMDEDGKPDILLGGVNGYITVLKNFIGVPKPLTVCPGETIVLNEVPSGASSFQWQVSVDSGKTFSNITPGSFYTGENTRQLTITGITTSLYGNIYKCVTNTGTPPGNVIKISHSWKTNAPGNQWENPANWSCGSVPEGMTDVIIPAGANVIVNSQASCRSILIAIGATVTLQTGAQLNILK